MQPILFVDLDGVLVNLTQGLTDILGIDMSKLSKPEFTKTYYKFIRSLNQKDIFDFWTNLSPTEDCHVIWKAVQKYQPLILTAVGNCMTTCEGKKNWCKKHLGLSPERVFCSINSEDKQNYASPKCILIDDHEKNIEQFTKKGGYGIHHTHTKKTLSKFKKILKKWDSTL